jgi:hypothetical protein
MPRVTDKFLMKKTTSDAGISTFLICLMDIIFFSSE